MILKVFDVDQGSCNFIKTSTGKTELVDFGGKLNWSPVEHVFANYVQRGGKLDRLVLTHHHGDHMKDVDAVDAGRIDMVLRRPLEGDYLAACRRSNTDAGQQLAERFQRKFASYTEAAPDWKVSDQAWGIHIERGSLSVAEAASVSSTDGSLANNCSYVRLYDHNGTKILLAGDMEKEGMALLLTRNPKFREALRGLSVLVAPHHGHRTAFCAELFAAVGRADLIIASMMSGDQYVDTRYSDSTFVRGIPNESQQTVRLVTTRTYGAITVESQGGGGFHVTVNQR